MKSDLSRKVSDYLTEVHTILFFEDTIQESLDKLRGQKITDKIIYFYVVDKDRKLMGVVPTRKLLLYDPNTKISDIVQYSTVRLKATDTLRDALEVFEKHKLLALPVVDEKDVLKGAVDVELYFEESFDAGDSRHRRDVFQIIGLTLEEKISFWRGYRLRMPWLFCNMLSGIVCAIISLIHEVVLGQFLVLAMFIPLVLTLSESVSMQSMTQSLQFLRHPKITWRYIFLKTVQEWKTVGLIALSSGFLVGLISLLWKDGFLASLTIGTGILFSVVISASFGICIPVLLHLLRLDPKVAAGPVVLMFADALTTLFYLSLASWWLL